MSHFNRNQSPDVLVVIKQSGMLEFKGAAQQGQEGKEAYGDTPQPELHSYNRRLGKQGISVLEIIHLDR